MGREPSSNGKPKNGNGNHKRGRPPRVLTPEEKAIAIRLMDAGATDRELCHAINCDTVTLYAMLRREPDFLTSRKGAKEHADARVEKSLYERANGYDVEEKTVEGLPDADGKVRPLKVTITHKRVAPDTASMIFWLKNRKPKEWRDKRELDVNSATTLADLIVASNGHGE